MSRDPKRIITVTTFKSRVSTAPVTIMKLEDMLALIKSDTWKEKILACRKDLKKKDWLQCFAPTGEFSHRSINGMDFYNGIMCLDVDNIDDPEAIKEKVKNLSWIHSMFITASGRGLKVIIKTNGDEHNYTVNEEKVAALWLKESGVPRDNHCKDIARIQYISWDPKLYYNPDSEMLDVTIL